MAHSCPDVTSRGVNSIADPNQFIFRTYFPLFPTFRGTPTKAFYVSFLPMGKILPSSFAGDSIHNRLSNREY